MDVREQRQELRSVGGLEHHRNPGRNSARIPKRRGVDVQPPGRNPDASMGRDLVRRSRGKRLRPRLERHPEHG